MRFNPIARTVALIVGFAIVAGATAARPALRDVEHVREGLISAGIAIELADKCQSLDVRVLRGISFLHGLRSHAEGLGYSRSEIEAYIDNDAEKDRLEGIARERLVALGAVVGDWDSYCAVGRGQIAAATQVGNLLR